MIENREYLDVVPTNDGIDEEIETELSISATSLSAELPEFVRTVERLHGGTIYRADFQVTGFWVMQIGFSIVARKDRLVFRKASRVSFSDLAAFVGLHCNHHVCITIHRPDCPVDNYAHGDSIESDSSCTIKAIQKIISCVPFYLVSIVSVRLIIAVGIAVGRNLPFSKRRS